MDPIVRNPFLRNFHFFERKMKSQDHCLLVLYDFDPDFSNSKIRKIWLFKDRFRSLVHNLYIILTQLFETRTVWASLFEMIIRSHLTLQPTMVAEVFWQVIGDVWKMIVCYNCITVAGCFNLTEIEEGAKIRWMHCHTTNYNHLIILKLPWFSTGGQWKMVLYSLSI